MDGTRLLSLNVRPNSVTEDRKSSEGTTMTYSAKGPLGPLISIAIEPKNKAEQEKLGLSLGKLATEDPSFHVNTDQDSGRTIISGMDELQDLGNKLDLAYTATAELDVHPFPVSPSQ